MGTLEMDKTAQLVAESAYPRLDQFLAARLEGLSRTRIQTLIKSGSVKIDGEAVFKARESLSGGERIQVEIPVAAIADHLEPEDIPLDVLHEDEQIIVLNKPAGLVIHPGSGNRQGTLVNALIGRYQRLSKLSGRLRPGIVHRLDKNTSGVMVVARTEEAHVHLARQFERREVQKTYLALVWGTPPESGKVEANLVRDPHNRLLFRTSQAQGRAAITAFSSLEYFNGFTLLQVRPRTGRTHQIRVHLAYSGYPIFNDRSYHGVRTAAGIAPDLREMVNQLRRTIDRQALHASTLTFVHPASQEMMTFEAPLADDFQAALGRLRQASSD
ncbi:MAG: RluA family pseudouridine synthase [Fidelibacterota bacterium]|nr:MAG: RluA family pseudouridine synthase [Candidatus Neomarinimicrobiota bacterium]